MEYLCTNPFVMPEFSVLGWNVGTVVLAVFGVAFLVQLVYWIYFFIRVRPLQVVEQHNFPPVSVVICARNEAANLEQFLPLVLEQEYPEFQVVVVNDASWDHTEDVLQALGEKHNHLHVVNIKDKDEVRFTKKQALTLGVKGAKHEHLVLTDADCTPTSNLWLKTLAGNFSTRKNVILGYSPYQKKKGFLNTLIRFDAFFIGMQYLSFARAGIPYMGVGRNLAYTKTLFFSVGGFRSHYHLSSGDDDLFINEVSDKKNTEVALSPESHTISVPKDSWKAWWGQKKRHFTTAPHYRPLHKVLLFLLPMSTMLFFVSAIVLLGLQFWWVPVLATLGIRLLLQIVIFSRAMKTMGDKDLLLLAPLLEIVFIVLNPLIYGSNLVMKSNR